MKFKTPSKPVVRFAYYAGNKLPKNSQNTVGHVLTAPNGGKFFAGSFLKMGENSSVLRALDPHMHGVFPVFCFEDNKRLFNGKSLRLLVEQTSRSSRN
jgi:hypothetical protein